MFALYNLTILKPNNLLLLYPLLTLFFKFNYVYFKNCVIQIVNALGILGST